MKPKILFLIFFTSILSYGQTKVIAHKSHSGSKNSFTKAYKKNLFDINDSNFGTGWGHVLILDSVIAINKTRTILKIRTSKKRYPDPENYKACSNIQFESRTDTLINDSVFNIKNSQKKIKLLFKQKYYYKYDNPIDEVIFIGFKQ